MTSSLTFHSTQFDVVDRNGHPWIRSKDLASALGYADDRKVSALYARHREEFSNDMSVVLNLSTTGNLLNETRIFSLRGCHLLAMFARTPVAKAFRVWVLDVLESLNGGASVPALESSFTPSTAEERAPLRALVFAWSRAANAHVETCWPQVKAHFQLSRIDDLPVEWLPDALAFVQGKIDALPLVSAREGGLVAVRARGALQGQGNARAYNSPEFLRREIAGLEERIEERAAEISRWSYAVEEELARLTGPLYRHVLEGLPARPRSVDAGLDALNRPGRRAFEEIRFGLENLTDAVRFARFFAKALGPEDFSLSR